MTTGNQERQQWFEAVWRQREEIVYPSLFGPLSNKMCTLSARWFESMGFKEIDPRWLTHGVLESPPNASRESWLYVTTGLSNPWGVDPAEVQRDQYSGLGFEFFMQTSAEAPWAVDSLSFLMAMQILAAQELIGGGLLEPYDRIPLGRSIDGTPHGLVRNVFVVPPEHILARVPLDSGVFDLMLCVGITDAELQFARAQDGQGLQQLLIHHGCLPITEATRSSTV